VRPIPSLTLEQQVGYLDAQYKVFNDNQATGPGLNGSRAFQTPAFSPKWTSRSAFGWTVPLGGIGSARLGADASYRDEMALAVDNSRITAAPGLAPNVPVGARFPGMWQDAYWLYNAALIWTLPNENFSLTLAGKNLSDEVYKTDAQEFSGIGGIQTAYYGAPRTVSLTLGVRF
jgi:iron complex outermembrane receptor protein